MAARLSIPDVMAPLRKYRGASHIYLTIISYIQICMNINHTSRILFPKRSIAVNQLQPCDPLPSSLRISQHFSIISTADNKVPNVPPSLMVERQRSLRNRCYSSFVAIQPVIQIGQARLRTSLGLGKLWNAATDCATLSCKDKDSQFSPKTTT
jgi:hypothetical protein